MTRTEARGYLRSVHPLLAAYAVLSEALGRQTVERRAEAVHAKRGHEPRSARHLYRDGELEDALEMLRLRATYRLDRGMDVPVAREDLMELLASDLPEVRLLGIRLAARGS